MDALVIGGSRFIGPPTVKELRESDYTVTIFNRGNSPHPFPDDPKVDRIIGNRKSREDLVQAKQQVNPTIVIDLVGYQPSDVREAVDIFADVDAYVFVSSAAAYQIPTIPIIEGETPLHECTDDQAVDDSMATYGPRKAECDRIISSAGDQGINAMSVRPPIVYGPADHTERLDYWITRVLDYEQILVPGDGTNIMHRVFVNDVASALRIVAEHGKSGETYNCGDRRAETLGRIIDRIGETANTSIEPIFSSERELGPNIAFDDFPLYTAYPIILDTDKIASLGWQSTDPETALERTVEDNIASSRTGRQHGPERDLEERVIRRITSDAS